MLDQVHERHRQHEEQADREREGDHEDGDPEPTGEFLGLLPQLYAGGDRERLESDPERLDQGDRTAQDRDACELAQPLAFGELELLNLDITERGVVG